MFERLSAKQQSACQRLSRQINCFMVLGIGDDYVSYEAAWKVSFSPGAIWGCDSMCGMNGFFVNHGGHREHRGNTFHTN